MAAEMETLIGELLAKCYHQQQRTPSQQASFAAPELQHHAEEISGASSLP
jgi:hypothetical protein